MNTTVPSHASIVVIGGGAIGTSIAYNLVKSGAKDVLLLEKTHLTEGATWHAAGLVGQLRSQQNLMRLMRDSVQVFDDLLADTGQDPSWRKVGSLRLARTPDRWAEILKSHAGATALGLESSLLSPVEAKELFPLINPSDLIGAAYIPSDGYIDPNSLTQAFAKGTRKYGGKIIEGVQVTGLTVNRQRITHVVTDCGTIKVETVVNAAGLWARQLGWLAGVDIPAGIVQHQYLVTEKSAEIPDGLPALRDPDGSYYLKPEPGAFAIGGWESNTVKVNPNKGFPLDRARHLFDANTDRLEGFLTPAMQRLPILETLGIRTIINGPIPISPDGEPIMGPVPGFQNFYAACGFTSGIAASGGAGKAMAGWILNGDPEYDLWQFDIRRFGRLHSGAAFLHDRAVESYGKYYKIHYPGSELATARAVRRSPLYQTLKDQGAVFGSKAGWERANWFGAPQKPSFSRGPQADTVGAEHKAAREAVVMFDQTSFSKFEISGEGACALLQYLAVANVDKPVGGATYTQLCNEFGGIEADVTFIRRGENCFWMITGSALGGRDSGWIKRHMSGFPDVRIRDITSAYGVINLAGPYARKVLEKLTNTDVSSRAFPFMSTQDIRLGYAPALAYRITYIGEQGWELYIPTEYMAYAYELLQDAGREFGIRNAGYHAIDSLRMEKRFLAWGADITPDYTPFHAGLQFLIDWKKGDFIGRNYLVSLRKTGVDQRLITLILDKPLPVFGGETVFANGAAIAQSTSGNFGYTIKKPIVFAYVPSDLLDAEFSVNSFGETCTAQRIVGAPYDPGRT